MYAPRSQQPPAARSETSSEQELGKLYYNYNLDAYAYNDKAHGDVWMRIRVSGREPERVSARSGNTQLTIDELMLSGPDFGIGGDTLGLWVGVSPVDAHLHRSKEGNAKPCAKKYSVNQWINVQSPDFNTLSHDPNARPVVAGWYHEMLQFRKLLHPNSNGVSMAVSVGAEEVFFAPQYRDDHVTGLPSRRAAWNGLVKSALRQRGRTANGRDAGRTTLNDLEGLADEVAEQTNDEEDDNEGEGQTAMSDADSRLDFTSIRHQNTSRSYSRESRRSHHQLTSNVSRDTVRPTGGRAGTGGSTSSGAESRVASEYATQSRMIREERLIAHADRQTGAMSNGDEDREEEEENETEVVIHISSKSVGKISIVNSSSTKTNFKITLE
ncbi:hypothetical protein BT63DRAFT_453519 [Microthyrium microscopicum]|uniref:Uncharacterized protein n=1 Tax=Microthyrium microscopicum TaxID=703497 RepID=A0A6A6UG14_9PEZI|nr:hypothetical protein BT63DRAFT_453519 [Microthyrium microscopicum]